MSTIGSLSTENRYATVTGGVDITGSPIDVALPTTATEPTTWISAEVVSVVASGSGRWTATYRLLIGPAAPTTLAAGTYDWWRRVTDSPEIPVTKVGMLKVVDGWTTPAP
ncbi:MAG: hypothetical protein ACRDQA_01370 [Nocardioidaceae bacterium]